MAEWFRRYFTEEGDIQRSTKKELEKQMELEARQGELVSKIPPYSFDKWQATHKGFRMENLSTVLQRNVIGLITMGLVCVTMLLLFAAQANATLLYDTDTKQIHKFPDPLYMSAALTTGVIGLAFLGVTVAIVLYFRKVLDKFYDNSKVYEIEAKNFLNERWHIKLFNGLKWEIEPIGKATLMDQKVEVDAKLADLTAELGAGPQLPDGKTPTDGQKEAHKIRTNAEIAKYRSVKDRVDACLNGNMSICSIESRDHAWIWNHYLIQYAENGNVKEKIHSVLEKEVGWKAYLAVPGTNLEECTGTDELLTDIGWKSKLLDNYRFGASVDLPSHPEIIEDPETRAAVIVDIPLLGVRDTPNSGRYYDWTEADSILVSKLLDAPLSASMLSEREADKRIIAQLEEKLAASSDEKIILKISDIVDDLRSDVRQRVEPEQPEIQRPMNSQPQLQQQCNNNNSWSLGKKIFAACSCVALLSVAGLAIKILATLL